MQALSPPSLIPCYAAEDRETARSVAEFLEQCGDVRVLLEDGELRPGDRLEEKAREARTADVVLILFSQRSLPRPWLRRDWEEALIRGPAEEGTRMAFARIDDCNPPKVLVPQFELPKALRPLKRWICHRAAAYDPPELEPLAMALVDQAGCEAAASRRQALEFARAYCEDFDGVFQLAAGGRSLAALAGDLAAQLGLRLEGPLEENVERLRDFCSARRFLLLLDGVAAPVARQLSFGGRCSTIIVEQSAAEPSSHAPDDPLSELSRAQRAFANPDRAADWEELCEHARVGRRICGEQGRIAECFELMQQWHAEAQARGERAVLEESAREMVWILESWGRADEAARLEYQRVMEFGQQMILPLWPGRPGPFRNVYRT